jgi:microcystin-dependent protein
MSDPFIGEIILFGGNFAPRAWAFCNGGILPISNNTALFSIIGTTYGGDGRTTTGLPDLRGRTAMHAGNGPGLSPKRLGQKGGTASSTLSTNTMASHTHAVSAGSVNGNDANGTQLSPVGNYLAKDPTRERLYKDGDPAPTPVDMNAGAVTVTVANAGGAAQPFTNEQPWLGINYIICLQGTYPSRS